MNRKICLVSNTAWSFTRFRMDLVRWLVGQGMDVLLLAPADEQVEDLVATGARFIPLRKMKRQGKNPLADRALYHELKAVYGRERPDLVVQYTIKPNIYGTLAASRLGIPAIAVVTGLGYAFINKGLVTAVAKRLYRHALGKARQVWFLNADDRDFFAKNRLVDPSKSLLVPGEGINCATRFTPQAFPSVARESGQAKFLFVGRLLYDKGIREYVAAAKKIRKDYPGVRFGILGYLNVDNPAAVAQGQLETWVREGWVTYYGAVDDVRPIVADADCVVLPSYREGMSTTLQESAAMAKPLIASDIAGCKELVDDGVTGYLCRVKDSDDLAGRMRALLALSVAERTRMGEQGREKMLREFSVDRVIRVYESTINEILEA